MLLTPTNIVLFFTIKKYVDFYYLLGEHTDMICMKKGLNIAFFDFGGGRIFRFLPNIWDHY